MSGAYIVASIEYVPITYTITMTNILYSGVYSLVTVVTKPIFLLSMGISGTIPHLDRDVLVHLQPRTMHLGRSIVFRNPLAHVLGIGLSHYVVNTNFHCRQTPLSILCMAEPNYTKGTYICYFNTLNFLYSRLGSEYIYISL